MRCFSLSVCLACLTACCIYTLRNIFICYHIFLFYPAVDDDPAVASTSAVATVPSPNVDTTTSGNAPSAATSSSSSPVPVATTSSSSASHVPGPHTYCVNCGRRQPHGTSLCPICEQKPECRTCHRRLPPRLIDATTSRCVACTEKIRKVRCAGGGAVQEYELAVDEDDVSYAEYITANEHELNRIVDGIRQSQR